MPIWSVSSRNIYPAHRPMNNALLKLYLLVNSDFYSVCLLIYKKAFGKLVGLFWPRIFNFIWENFVYSCNWFDVLSMKFKRIKIKSIFKTISFHFFILKTRTKIIFKTLLLFHFMKSYLQTDLEFNPEIFLILGNKWRFGYFHFHSKRICQAVLTSSV